VSASSNTDLVISNLDRARVMLLEATTIPEAKRCVDLGVTAETWIKQQHLGAEIAGYAHSFTTDALCSLGRMLKATAETGERVMPKTARSSTDLEVDRPTLADLGIDYKTSAIAQKLADLPAEQLAQVRAGTASITQALRHVKAESIARAVTAPDAKYRVLLADPPWSYGNTQPDYHTEQRDHYPVQSTNDICALPVAEWCEPNAVLFLWVTSPILEESFEVIAAWGFKYKTSFVWDKVKHNMGHYNSVRHELLLVCTRGSCMPDVAKLFDSVVTQERTTHSTKPEIFREIIDTIYPHGKRIELFARAAYPGWDSYGYEADSRAA
jgi:N6-adenosine-specific RNA methylase IME4